MADFSSLYSKYLGRDGSKDAQGTSFYKNQLSSGAMTMDQIGKAIASSPEAQKFKSTIRPTSAAPANFNSVAEQQARFTDGQSRATSYQKSGFKPVASYAGRNTNDSFINAVYQNETGRDADQEGRDYWMGQMASGMTRDQVVDHFNRSKEGTGYDNPQQEQRESASPSLQGAAQATLPQAKTVAGLLDTILAKDSPLMQRAATQGKQFANNRGLLNSSMAGGAAQGAMIDRATPIASQDSQSALSLSQFNAGQTNDMRRQSNDFQIRSNLMEQGQGYDLQKMQSQFGYTSQLATQEAEQALSKLYASSNANAWGVMANNVTDLVGQASSQIQDVQMNPDISAEKNPVTEKNPDGKSDKELMIDQVIANRNTDIGFQGAMYQNLSEDLMATGVFPDMAA